ncbi:transcription factor E [Metallosphaera hakonensis]|uniref:Transcription factor E n=1 Tax=Metallosphaera hakonensis JCM 8857 = DSM 7519 TaxID=1293036 RepID=A0A2U9IX65_9CREN|nr:transcription factor E [Metallosphaera hakonensis]AWS00610.1 transcription factor E [Metallosphaera hakonensis JCM 8857 = DSM 7519]
MKDMARDLLGEDVIDVLSFLLDNKAELTDEEMANKLNVKVNEVRKKLYALADHGLVSYRRTRDKESGWYVYFWKANVDQINELLLARKREILNKLKARLEYESNNEFYICPEDKTKYTFEEAFENEFKCPKCGVQLTYYDSARVRELLEQKIKEIEEEIARETKVGSS